MMTEEQILDLAYKHLLYYEDEGERGGWYGDKQDVLEFAEAVLENWGNLK